MIFKISYCKRLVFMLILCIYQQSTVQTKLQKKETTNNLETSHAIVAISKNYNNLIDIFRKNWESPMAYLIQRGYIPIEEAKPDKTSRDAIKKMQKEYGMPEDSLENPLNLLQDPISAESAELNAKFLPLRQTKSIRRDVTKPPCTTVSPQQSPVTEMKCVKWEPVPVSTTAPDSATKTEPVDSLPPPPPPPQAADASKSPSTTPPAISTSTVSAAAPAPASTAPTVTKPTAADDVCEEYYDDVTECYEYEVYEDGSSTTTEGSKLSTTTTECLPAAPKTLPICTTPSLVENNVAKLSNISKTSEEKLKSDINLSWHPYNIKKYVQPPTHETPQRHNEDPAFKLASIIARNTVKEYLRNSFYRPKTQKYDVAKASADINDESRLKRTQNSDLIRYADSVLPKQWHSWRSYPLSWHSKNLPNIEELHPGPHPPTVRPSIEHSMPQTNFKYYQPKENPNPNSIDSSKNFFKSENNKTAVSKMNINDYDYNDPNSDGAYVSLNAIYMGNNQLDKKVNTEILDQHFDNIEQSAMPKFQSQHLKSFDSDLPLYNKFQSMKPLKFPLSEDSLNNQNKLVVSNDNSPQFNSFKTVKPATNLYTPPSYKPTFFHENTPWKSSNFYNTPASNEHASNEPKVTNNDSPTWTSPALSSSNEESDSIYAQYQAKNDPLKSEFWQNMQGTDQEPSIDIFETHKPDPATYPHNKLVNLYKYKNMNKNLENYFRFNQASSDRKEPEKISSSNNDKENVKEQRNHNSKPISNDLASQIIDTAVRNVTARTFNNI